MRWSRPLRGEGLVGEKERVRGARMDEVALASALRDLGPPEGQERELA